VYARKDIARIIRKGDSIQADSSVFTVELSAAMDLAFDKLRSAPDADMEAYLKRCGILAIDRVRAALASLPQDSPARPALSRIDHVYRLKETVAAEIEDAEPKVYDILSSGTTEQRCDLLLFIFPRFVEESVPLAEFLALDTNMEPTIRSWSVDFLRRLQKNRELLRVYKLSSGQGQLAAAVRARPEPHPRRHPDSDRGTGARVHRSADPCEFVVEGVHRSGFPVSSRMARRRPAGRPSHGGGPGGSAMTNRCLTPPKASSDWG
jgi:hypothetical protein